MESKIFLIFAWVCVEFLLLSLVEYLTSLSVFHAFERVKGLISTLFSNGQCPWQNFTPLLQDNESKQTASHWQAAPARCFTSHFFCICLCGGCVYHPFSSLTLVFYFCWSLCMLAFDVWSVSIMQHVSDSRLESYWQLHVALHNCHIYKPLARGVCDTKLSWFGAQIAHQPFTRISMWCIHCPLNHMCIILL